MFARVHNLLPDEMCPVQHSTGTKGKKSCLGCSRSATRQHWRVRERRPTVVCCSGQCELGHKLDAIKCENIFLIKQQQNKTTATKISAPASLSASSKQRLPLLKKISIKDSRMRSTYLKRRTILAHNKSSATSSSSRTTAANGRGVVCLSFAYLVAIAALALAAHTATALADDNGLRLMRASAAASQQRAHRKQPTFDSYFHEWQPRKLSNQQQYYQQDHHHHQQHHQQYQSRLRRQSTPAGISNDAIGAQTECHKLIKIWHRLLASYPLLAQHLMLWSSKADRLALDGGAQQPLDRLLDEAELRLGRNSNSNNNNSNNNKAEQLSGNNVGRPPGSAWLARISANPNYARLVAHLRAKQQSQHGAPAPATSSTTTTTTTTMSTTTVEAPTTTATTTSNAHLDNRNQHISYGHVARYPHELALGRSRAPSALARRPVLAAADGEQLPIDLPTSMNSEERNAAQTLEKLHLLSKHTQRMRQAQEAELQSNQIERAAMAALPASDIEQQFAGKEWLESSKSAADVARDTYVYGKVRHWPHQEQPDFEGTESEQEQQRRRQQSDSQQTLSALHDLANEHGKQQHNNTEHHQETDLARQQQHQVPTTSSELSFGTVVLRPPPANDNNNEQGIILGTQTNLDSGEYDNHELLEQQRGQQFEASNSNDPVVPQTETDNGGTDSSEPEFEGHFHSSPLKQVGARRLTLSSSSLDDSDQNDFIPATYNQLRALAKDDQQPAAADAVARNVFIID